MKATLLICLLLIPAMLPADGSELVMTLVELEPMSQGRYNHSSAVSEGRLFVFGGTENGLDPISSVEVHQDGAWSTLSPMSVPRMRHTSDVLPSGRVLVAGGFTGDGIAHPSLLGHFKGRSRSYSSCEVLDPATGTWSPADPMDSGRFWHGSVVLADGRVMVIGGLNSTIGALSSCEVYDEATDEWGPAAPISSPRARFSVTLLADGRVMIAGGHNGTMKKAERTVEIYDPALDRWSPAAPMLESRGYFGSVLLEDGRVLVSGGFSEPGQPDRDSSEVYDPATDKWTMAGEMAFPRHNQILEVLQDGKVGAFGGSNCITGGSHSNVETFDPSTGEWEMTGMIMAGRIWMGADVMEGGAVVTHGGKACISAHPGAERFELSVGPERGTGLEWMTLAVLAVVPIVLWRSRRWTRG